MMSTDGIHIVINIPFVAPLQMISTPHGDVPRHIHEWRFPEKVVYYDN